MKYVLSVFGILTVGFLVLKLNFTEIKKNKPSLLFINLCSLRADRLKIYGGDPAIAPELNRASENAIVFENFITRASWVNFNMSFYPNLMNSPEKINRMRSFYPWSETSDGDLRGTIGRFYTSHFRYIEYFEKTGPGWDTLISPLVNLIGKNARFHHNFLFKMAHFPYSPEFRNQIPYEKFLSEKSLSLYRKYLKDYQSQEMSALDKIPVNALLFGDRKSITSQVILSEQNQFTSEDPLGVMNNEKFLERWKNSSGYSDDLILLNQAYNAKLNYSDSLLKPFLNQDSSIYPSENTILVVAADHGTAFMEHGNIHNGHIPYDELIRVPLFIRFPGLKKQIRVKSQVSEIDLQNLIFSILDDSVNSENIQNYLNTMGTDFILSVDCTKRHFSVRSKDGWKLIKDFTSGKSQLYNLLNDPKETMNTLAQNLDLAKKLENEFLKLSGDVQALKKIRCPNLTAGSKEHLHRMMEKQNSRQ